MSAVWTSIAYYAARFALWCLHNPQDALQGVNTLHDVVEDVYHEFYRRK